MYISGADNNPGLKSIINTGVSHVINLSQRILFLMNIALENQQISLGNIFICRFCLESYN